MLHTRPAVNSTGAAGGMRHAAGIRRPGRPLTPGQDPFRLYIRSKGEKWYQDPKKNPDNLFGILFVF